MSDIFLCTVIQLREKKLNAIIVRNFLYFLTVLGFSGNHLYNSSFRASCESRCYH